MLLAGANAPQFTQVPQVHGGGEGVPVQGTLLRLFHGSASFYQGMAPVSAILHRMGYDFVATWTPGCFRHPDASRFSLF